MLSFYSPLLFLHSVMVRCHICISPGVLMFEQKNQEDIHYGITYFKSSTPGRAAGIHG